MDIIANNLSYNFSIPAWSFGNKTVFEATKLTLPKNQWTALLGRSGCGKSTLLRVVVGLLEPVIARRSKALTRQSSDERSPRRNTPRDDVKITYMAQQDALLPWATIIENVILPQKFTKSPDRAKAHQLISDMGLEGYSFSKPGELSAGMRQRVALARTLMTNADIILLDEPFSALDCLTRHEMHLLTQYYFKGKTIFLVTHDPDEADKLCSKTYLMKNGYVHPYQFLPSAESHIEKLMEDLCV